MHTKQITDKNDKWYKPFREIYEYSFPLHEQRTEQQQEEAFSHEAYHLDVFMEGEDLVGFLSYWKFEDYIYIEHFAINKSFRGNNIGTKLLSSFTGKHPQIVLLEIDPLVDDISRKRFEFYKRNGFRDNPYPHSHPAYRAEFPPHQLIVLSHGDILTEEIYHQFNQDLQTIVMKQG